MERIRRPFSSSLLVGSTGQSCAHAYCDRWRQGMMRWLRAGPVPGLLAEVKVNRISIVCLGTQLRVCLLESTSVGARAWPLKFGAHMCKDKRRIKVCGRWIAIVQLSDERVRCWPKTVLCWLCGVTGHWANWSLWREERGAGASDYDSVQR